MTNDSPDHLRRILLPPDRLDRWRDQAKTLGPPAPRSGWSWPR